MFQDLDLGELRRMPRIGYYFRYPLPRDSFRELRVEDRLRGHYTAKPLYGRLSIDGATTGRGVNVLGHDCLAVGTLQSFSTTVDAPG
jgi:hypothetical protein